jgi:hypothetical protein
LWHISDILKHYNCAKRILKVGNILKAPIATLRLDRSYSEAFFCGKGCSEKRKQQERTIDIVNTSWPRVYSGTDL